MHYDLRLRPAQPGTPAPDAFVIHRREVPPTDGRDGLSQAFVHEGLGGYPLLLLHGYPETKRIWWRNIAALADAGYEVIAPDLRGYGDSDLSAADVYDPAAWSRPRLSDHLRGGIHCPHRPSRFARGRAFFAVGAYEPVQPAGHRVFRRRARSPGAIGTGRP
jgi:hypothetical protein